MKTETSFNIKRAFIWITVIFSVVILVNIVGQLSLRNINVQVAKTKKMTELIHTQELALIHFISASSNSAIGLATENWDLLLSEREIIATNIVRFEDLGDKIKTQVHTDLKNNQWFFDYSDKINREWENMKRLSVIILRTKNSELARNEALPVFIASTKNLQQIFHEFEEASFLTNNLQESRAEKLTKLISYLNLGFQICAIPLLVFFIFIPGLQRAKEFEFLRANQVSLAKLSALGEMAGGVAHEINNPLAIIMNLSSQMNELLTEDPIERDILIKKAKMIEKTSGRIAKIVLGLKIFSRDGSKDTFQQINVKQLIQDTISLCQERFKNHSIDLKVEGLSPELTFEGRATEISQILLNLLNNSHDAILNYKEKWVVVSVTEKDNWLEISVTDCGNGISPEIQQKIFQPFFTTKEIGKGTGLGLSISDGIIKGHKGELRNDPEHVNTRFIIRLPRTQKGPVLLTA